MSAPRSHHERGQLFGTDGHSTWFEPELGGAVQSLATGVDDIPDDPYCDYCEQLGHTFRSCPQRDDSHESDYSEATGDYGQWD